MPSTITWNDGEAVAQVTIPDEVVASLDQFRQTVTSIQDDGKIAPTFPTVRDMIAGIVADRIKLAISRFPPASHVAAKQAVDAAQTQLAQLQAAAIPAFAPVSEGTNGQ